jgi:hypothetical protein
MSLSTNILGVSEVLDMISHMLCYFETKHSISTISYDFINNLVIYKISHSLGDILLYKMLHCYLIDHRNMSWDDFLVHWNGLTRKQVHKLYQVEENKYTSYCDGIEYDPSHYEEYDYDDERGNETMATIIERMCRD